MLENGKKHELTTVIPELNKCQHPHSPFHCWKIVKCKLALHQSVLSTLHRGGEGQNAYTMEISNPCDQGCSCFVLQVPQCEYCPTMCDSVPCDRIVRKAYFVNILNVQINTFVTMNLQGDSRWDLSFGLR